MTFRTATDLLAVPLDEVAKATGRTYGTVLAYRNGVRKAPPEVLEKLATPFFTTRIGGTGLGLALSRHWVACHDGTLRIESTLGEGTRVRVEIPMRTAT